jgi:hypothetical protein
MTTRILGPEGGRRRRRFLLVPMLVAVALAVVYVTGAQAVHDVGVFQLDRNAQTSVPAGAAGEDWDMVCPASTPPGAASCIGGTTAVASTFDTDGANATIFTGGGSKDDLDTTSWNWKNGSVPDKDDLAHAYAARYLSGGNVYLYFGANRIANNGDSQIGFWFFLGSVGPLAGGTFGPSGHTNGDILVLSDFTQGGTVVTVRVFEWHSPGGAINGTLDLIAGTTSTTADCIGPPAVSSGDQFCATVNTAVTPSPWQFTDKSGANPGSFNPGEFYEGGINLSALGLGNECFSSFLSETRSSQSVDATLKDFVGGKFAVCGATMSTTPSVGAGTKVLPGTQVSDTATVTGSGTASPPTPTGNVTFFICGPIATGTCSSAGTQVGTAKPLSGSGATATATSDAFDTTGKAAGRYCWRAEWPGDSNYPGALTESGTGDSECFYVIDTTSITTAQDWLPNDSATITSAGRSALNGTLVFTLYDSGDCTGTVLYTEPTITLSGAASPATRSTSNTTVKVSASKTVSWKVAFSSTDPNVQGSSSGCETTSLTITN